LSKEFYAMSLTFLMRTDSFNTYREEVISTWGGCLEYDSMYQIKL
jgi:hypothetical protein